MAPHPTKTRKGTHKNVERGKSGELQKRPCPDQKRMNKVGHGEKYGHEVPVVVSAVASSRGSVCT